MSHIVKVKALEVRDEAALRTAVGQVEGAVLLKDGAKSTFNLYRTQSATGVGVQLKGWEHPAVFDLESGVVKYDNYNGQWGEQDELDSLLHRYAVEAAKNAAYAADPTVNCYEESVDGADETRLVMEYA